MRLPGRGILLAGAGGGAGSDALLDKFMILRCKVSMSLSIFCNFASTYRSYSCLFFMVNAVVINDFKVSLSFERDSAGMVSSTGANLDF